MLPPYPCLWESVDADLRQDCKELKMFKDLTIDNVIDKGNELLFDMINQVRSSSIVATCTSVYSNGQMKGYQ